MFWLWFIPLWAVTSVLGYGLIKGAIINDWLEYKLTYFEQDNVLIALFVLAPFVAFAAGVIGQILEHFMAGYPFRFCLTTPGDLRAKNQEPFLPNNLF